MNNPAAFSAINGSEIAIIGIAGRFPGAKNVDEFWKNLQNGVESISFFTDEELLSSGIDPAVLSNPNFVKARAVLEDVELFDASFFDFNPREAEITDPQHRLFLESASVAIENAGYDSETYSGSIGVYAGTSLSSYLLNVYLNQNIIGPVDPYQLAIGGDKDFLTTRVSYKLNLEGPSYTVQTSCSTSLVAVHLACLSLLNGECDMALAGGVSITSSRKAGYFYKEGGIGSPDGHCRAFDAKAQGTVGGEGVGIVVLKRLDDAIADGDSIHAVIKGSAINNDGSFKVSYTAPRIDSQAKVIRTAQVMAEVEPETIAYIEAHGTGTSLGDPIEIAALTQAFSLGTTTKNFCAIGSVKTNIGHLDAAAGVAGLIKTILALKHKQIPPSLHFEKPNPQIDFANSPFYVNTSLSEWKANGTPRRAGVSSFGIGGTNAHVILEEAPAVEASGPSRPWQLLLLSAKTSSALETATANLADYLQQHPDLNIADVAHTLQFGRRAFDHRRMLVCRNLDDAVKALSPLDPQRVFTLHQEPRNRPVVFMFSGQGAQYVNMALELYQSEPTFTSQVDYCCQMLRPHLGLDLRNVLYPNVAQAQEAARQLTQTNITQPALFAIEYALAKLWMAWGVRPEVMIGHSIGEYVAATLAGVFSLEDALALVATRGRLMQQLPKGAMLSVQLSEPEVQPLLGEELSLAASNGPSSCVVSGPTGAVDELQQKLLEKGVGCRRLHISHAFHSQMMEPIVEPFTESLRKVNLNPPKIPFMSNVSGTWITTAEATNPNYWARHLRQPVRFSQGLFELLKEPRILLEVGPGRTLSTLALGHQTDEGRHKNCPYVVLTSIRHPQEQQSDVAFLLNSLGRLWLAGVKVDWSGFYTNERRHHIPLPTYPFERQRYWIEPAALTATFEQKDADRTSQVSLDKKPDIADWFYIPSWKRSIPPQPFKSEIQATQPGCWLVFVDECGLGSQMVKQLEQEGQDVITVRVGEQFDRESDRLYTINPRQRNDYDALLKELRTLNKTLKKIVYLWSVTPKSREESAIESLKKSEAFGFLSLLFLAQALGEQNPIDTLQIAIVSNNMQEVTGEELLCPEKAMVLGPCKVIPLEYPNITCRSIDVVIPELETWQENKLIDQLLAELISKPSDMVIAYRGNYRWVQTFEPVRLDGDAEKTPRLRQRGVYLITGGLGGVGLALAEYLAQTVQAKLILIGRSAFPNRDEWVGWLASHDEQDGVSRKIRKLQALEDLGAEVLVACADVTNQEQMEAIVTQASNRFCQINGAIHAAAVPGGGIIQLKTPETAANALAPKVMGTRVLDVVFKDAKLDFFVLCSSLNSFLGASGLVDYCAENAFLDAFAHYRASRNGTFTTSINWDRWENLGMAVAVEARHKEITGEDLPAGMTSEEGIEAFRRILFSSTVPQIVVSTQDFPTLIRPKDSAKSLEEELAQVSRSKPTHPRPNLGNAYVAPRNEVERTLADIWQRLFGIEQVGIHDNFFELGGDSLLATQLVSQLCKTFEIELPYKSFFNAPSVAELAEAIVQKLAKQTDREALAQSLADNVFSRTKIRPQSRESNSFPLSFAQQRLWFIDQFEPGNIAYNISQAIRLSGRLNVAALQQSFNEVVRRHEALRTTFTTVEGQPIQVIGPVLSLTLPVVDLRELPNAEQEAEVKRLTKEKAQQPFNLAQAPLLRVTLLQLGEAEHVVLLTMHHIVSDGWSIGVLLRELASLYEAFSTGKPSPLPELPIQYTDFAVWQRQWLQREVLEAHLAYWKQQLSGGLPVLELPTDRPRPAVQTFRGNRQTLVLPKALTEDVKSLSKREGVTLFMTLLASFQTLLHWYTDQADVVVGTDVANRNRAEIEGLIGFFVNQLVLRTDLSGNPTFRELLLRVREVTLGAYAHQDLPFDKLVETLNPKRDLSRALLFSVKVVLQNAPMPPLALSGLTMSPLNVDAGKATLDLLVELVDTEQGLIVSLEYNTDLFDATSIARMLEHFETLLCTVVTQPQARLNELVEILTETDKQQQIIQKSKRKEAYHHKLKKVQRKVIHATTETEEAGWKNQN